MHLTWNGHSCFTLETRQGTLVLDPYRPGSVPGLPDLKLKADGVYCSHQHDDHAGAELVTLSGKGHTVQVEEIETYHDPEQGALRGKNTIRIFTAEGLRVAHLGDLGCELTQEQVERLAGLDALLFPVGGFYTIDAQQARKVVEQLKPRVAVPMHYRGRTSATMSLVPWRTIWPCALMWCATPAILWNSLQTPPPRRRCLPAR